jgi:hypothetical protein
LLPFQRPTSVPVSPSTRRIDPETSAPDCRRNTVHVRVSRGALTSSWTRRICHVPVACGTSAASVVTGVKRRISTFWGREFGRRFT